MISLLDMNHQALRELFESLCDYLEDEAVSPLHFRAGLGFESPAGVLMVFLFDPPSGQQERMAVVCRFPTDVLNAASASPAITTDECLSLIEKVRSLEDNFGDLFVTH